MRQGIYVFRKVSFLAGQILVVRALPGFLNLGAILVLSSRSPLATYGIYSTLLVVGLTISTILFGLIYAPIVYQYARFQSEGRAATYLATIAMLWGVATAAVAIAALLFSLMWQVSLVLLAVAAVVIAAGTRSLLQEIARSRLAFGWYAASDLAQATTLLLLVWQFARDGSSPEELLFLWVCAEALGLVIAASVLPFGRKAPETAMALEIVHVGARATIVTAADSILLLGTRWIAVVLGGPAVLGSFSIAADLAQRTVGFAVAATGFLYVPRAMKAWASRGWLAFRSVMREGTVLSFVAAAGSWLVLSAVVFGLQALGHWQGDSISLVALSIVCIATALNRLRKLIVDPIATLSWRQYRLVLAILMGSAVGIAVTGFLSMAGVGEFPAFGFAAGYAAILIASLWTVRGSSIGASDVPLGSAVIEEAR